MRTKRRSEEEPVSSPLPAKPNTNIDNPSVRTVPAPQNTNRYIASVSQQSGVDAQNTPEPEQKLLVFTDSIDIKNTGLDTYAMHSIQQDDVKMIEEYISKLKESGEYDALAAEVKSRRSMQTKNISTAHIPVASLMPPSHKE